MIYGTVLTEYYSCPDSNVTEIDTSQLDYSQRQGNLKTVGVG